MAAGASRVLLLGGLRGAAVAAAPRGVPRGAPSPRRAADGGGQAADGAGLGGGADPAAELPEAPPEPPRLALLQPGVAGVARQPPLAAPGPPPAAGRLCRGGGLPPSPLRRRARRPGGPEPGSAPAASPPPAAPQRGGKSACDQTQEEIELRVLRGDFGQLLRQQQNVSETLAALHFQRAGRFLRNCREKLSEECAPLALPNLSVGARWMSARCQTPVKEMEENSGSLAGLNFSTWFCTADVTLPFGLYGS